MNELYNSEESYKRAHNIFWLWLYIMTARQVMGE